MRKIEESEIKYVLKNYEEIQMRNYKRIIALYKEAEKEDAIEQFMCMSTPQTGGETTSRSGGKQELGDVLEHIHTMQRTRVIEVRQGLYDVTEEIEKANRLRFCYEALAKVDMKGYKIITKLYIEGQKYIAVTSQIKLSHRAFEVNRKKALEAIQKLYESGASNNSLMEREEILKLLEVSNERTPFRKNKRTEGHT